MQKPRTNFGLLLVGIVLAMLLAAYVGSYLYLVTPYANGTVARDPVTGAMRVELYHYRVNASWIPTVYWPVEQIDRKLRPGVWAGTEPREIQLKIPPRL